MRRLSPLLLLIVLFDLRCVLSPKITEMERTAQFLVETCTSQETPLFSPDKSREYVPARGLGLPQRREGGGAR